MVYCFYNLTRQQILIKTSPIACRTISWSKGPWLRGNLPTIGTGCHQHGQCKEYAMRPIMYQMPLKAQSSSSSVKVLCINKMIALGHHISILYGSLKECSNTYEEKLAKKGDVIQTLNNEFESHLFPVTHICLSNMTSRF